MEIQTNNNSQIIQNRIKNEEIHSINSTYCDSLHNINENILKEKNNKLKENNFYKALDLIKTKKNIIQESINEFSQACVNLSKEENVRKYLNNPIKKEIIKEGNLLKRISNFNDYNLSIKPIYSYNISNIIINNFYEKEKLNKNVYIKNSTTAFTKNEKKINDSIEIKSFNLEVINDLDEINEINLEKYKTNENKNKDNILILESIFNENETNNKNIFISSNLKIKYSNEKKLRKKFYKSDFKINKNKNESFLDIKIINMTNQKKYYFNKENSSLLSNNIIAKNLINNFNSCSKKSELIINILHNSSYLSKNTNNEIINFSSSNNSIINNNQNEENIFSTPKEKIKSFKINSFKSQTKNKNKINNKNNNNSNLNSSNFSNTFSKNKSKEKIEIETIYDIDFYNNLIISEKRNKIINPNYIINYLPKITWNDRRKVLNWLMEICEEFAFKRDTFHYSIYYFDNFLNENVENKNNLDYNYLKLIGISCISLSAKIEEIQIPKLKEYILTLENNFYDIDDIILMEKKIVNNLNWKIIPITINIWLSWYICQWDLFIETIDNIKNEILVFFSEENFLFFKKTDDNSYFNYRKITQIIDLIKLDENHFFYNERYLIAASIFLVLCLNFNFDFDFKNNQIIYQNSQIKNLIFNIYCNFIQQSFDYSFFDIQLIKSINYVWKFRNFKFTFDLPLIYQVEQKELENANYEDFISYQTYNEENLNFLSNLYSNK